MRVKTSIIILFLCQQYASLTLAQEIRSIRIQEWNLSEPPTQKGSCLFDIEYVRKNSGDFVAKYYEASCSRAKKHKVSIRKRISMKSMKQFERWRRASKKVFSLSELNVTNADLGGYMQDAPYKPYFQDIEDFNIKIDTFSFCKDYHFKQSISFGGYRIRVTLDMQDGREVFFEYETGDRGQYRFALNEYLILQPLLMDKLPDSFESGFLFSRRTLFANILYYLKVIECEYYYYQEFIRRYPERSRRENRMMIGWDFMEYLSNRSKK